MNEVKREIRFAQLASKINIGTGNLAQLIDDLGYTADVEHELIVKNVQLDQDSLEKYLASISKLNVPLFNKNTLSLLLPDVNSNQENYSFIDIKQIINDKLANNRESVNVNFRVSIGRLALALKTDRSKLSTSILNVLPTLPQEIYIKASTKIPENIIRAICIKEGLSFDEMWNQNSSDTIKPKVQLEGPTILGKIDLDSGKKGLAPTMQLVDIEQTQKKSYKKNFANSMANQNSTNDNINTQLKMKSPIQKILFGSPGTGKSWSIENVYLKALSISAGGENCIKTVFHPEYTYGDFMGKLMPHTDDEGGVEYRFYSGHFLKALAKSYKNIILAYIQYKKHKDDVEKAYKKEIDKSNQKNFTDIERDELQKRLDAVQKPIPQNVALIIDEINRGNSAAIFGVGFQLLDRDENGWSSYPVRITELEYRELLKEISLDQITYKKQGVIQKQEFFFDSNNCSESEYNEYRDIIYADLIEDRKVTFQDRNIKLPPNISIISSMNTSDNSIYFMDSAFKRRWDWEFIDITSEEQKQKQVGRKLEDGTSWQEFVDNLNNFIKDNGATIRKIEDKQIGYFFIKDIIVSNDSIRNKLQFFLWDSIFSNDKKPLERLLGNRIRLVTFGDFTKEMNAFIAAIKSYKQNTLDV